MAQKGGRLSGYYPSSEVFKTVDRSRYSRPRPSDAEFERRYKVIRKFMENKGLDCLLIAGASQEGGWVNYAWVCNFSGTPGHPYVVFSRKGEITAFTYYMGLQVPSWRAQFVVEDVRGGAPRDYGRMTVERIKELGYVKGRIGIVEITPYSLPSPDYKLLAEELPHAQFEFVARDWWKEVRAIKSKEEIDFIEKSAEIGDKMIEAIRDNIRPGMNEADIFAWMAHALVANGGQSDSLIVAASTNTFDSDNGLMGGFPLPRVLREGDIIINEVGPSLLDGSHSVVSRPFALGKPSEEYLGMIELMLKVYKRIIDQLRPGKTNVDLRKAASPIMEAGYEGTCPIIHGTPGVGASTYPCASQFDDPQFHLIEPFVLEPNMTVVPEVFIATHDYLKGVAICDTWLITEDDPRCLNKYPAQLTVI